MLDLETCLKLCQYFPLKQTPFETILAVFLLSNFDTLGSFQVMLVKSLSNLFQFVKSSKNSVSK